MEGQQRWGFPVQDTGFSWRFSQEYMSEEEIRHKELAYTAKWTWDYCAERPSHTVLWLLWIMTACRPGWTSAYVGNSYTIPEQYLNYCFILRAMSMWPQCCDRSLKLTSAQLQAAGMPTFNTGVLLWPSLFQGNLSHLVIFRKTYNSLPVKGIKSNHVEEANYFPKSKTFILCLAGCRMRTWNGTEQTRAAKSS